MVNGIDLKSMCENAITSALRDKARIPIVLASERDVMRALIATCRASDETRPRYVQIRNTLELNEAYLSKPMLDELGQTAEPEPMRFDDQHRLLTLV